MFTLLNRTCVACLFFEMNNKASALCSLQALPEQDALLLVEALPLLDTYLSQDPSLVVDLLLSKFFFYSIWIIRYKQLLINIRKGAKQIPYMPTYNYSRSSLCYLADFYMIIWTDTCWHIAFVNTTFIIKNHAYVICIPFSAFVGGVHQ